MTCTKCGIHIDSKDYDYQSLDDIKCHDCREDL